VSPTGVVTTIVGGGTCNTDRDLYLTFVAGLAGSTYNDQLYFCTHLRVMAVDLTNTSQLTVAGGPVALGPSSLISHPHERDGAIHSHARFEFASSIVVLDAWSFLVAEKDTHCLRYVQFVSYNDVMSRLIFCFFTWPPGLMGVVMNYLFPLYGA
jgi:hypothetical protein